MAAEHPEEHSGNATFGLPQIRTVLGAGAIAGARENTIPDIPVLPSPEQQSYAELVIDSMAEQLGLARDEVRIVIDDSAEPRQAVAIDASPNGQHIGLYSHILMKRRENPNWYTVDVGEQTVDPLAGCTRAVYMAMIADARDRGERFLPDSLALNQHNGHVWTATMMTGEPLDDEGKIWIGSSSSHNKVNFVGQDINRGGKSFRVRPAIPIGRLYD